MNGCIAYQYSNKRGNEEVRLTLRENPKLINTALLQEQTIGPQAEDLASRGFMVSDMVQQLAPVVVMGAKELIKAGQKNLRAEYSLELRNRNFYSYPSVKGYLDPAGMQFEGVKIVRTFRNEDNAQTDTAVVLSLSIDNDNLYEIINTGVFRLIVDDFELNYSKAKVPRKSEKLHLEVFVDMLASWITESGQYFGDVKIGNFYLDLPEIPMNPQSGEYQKYRERVKGQLLAGSSNLVPRSAAFYYDGNEMKQCFGLGNYRLAVTIKESGKDKMLNVDKIAY